ncbi:ATP-dependent acyl-CoA ligase [Actinomadura livida]|uniref:ATP-dependent acyl-CoA ligase n=1 Tax=Actinomadura livida TaxID=79909 RepID=A0ABP3PF80_9ACTN|nr:ATP-dependent acyl-CoA ligase [Actinomadura livida]
MTVDDYGAAALTRTTVDAEFRRRLEAEPDGPFVRCGSGWLTFAELDDRTDRLAAGFSRLGIGPGDMVATLLPNCIETVEIMLAAAKAGVVQVPLNYYLKGDFLTYQLNDCGASVLVTDEGGYDAARGLLGATGIRHTVLVDEPQPGTLPYGELLSGRGRPEHASAPGDLLAIMYTSGTTAAAKGCMLGSGYYVAVGRAYGLRGWVVPGDRMFTGFPMFHTSGQMVAFMSALVNDATISIAPEFHASTFIAEAAADGATMLVGVGPMAHMLLAQPPRPDDAAHRFRLAVWVPLGEPEQRAFEERFGTPVMSEGYGQTECVPITNSAPDGFRDRATSGLVSPLLEVRIVDDADNEVPLGEAGEIVVRPKVPNAMYAGYWNKPETTTETWRNLWHHTGDHGRMDANGCLTFVDRKKDVLRRRGENVSALALENTIRRHPAVKDVAVSGVPAAVGDEEIKASIVLEEGAELTPEGFFEFIRWEVPYFAVPRYVDVRAELPVNALSRVMKHVLRDEGVTGAMWDLPGLGLVASRHDRRPEGASA